VAQADATGASRVAILLSTFNGGRFVDQQLRSILAQTHQDWVLYWRDDGSDDCTAERLRAFAEGDGLGRCRKVEGGEHLGVMRSFFVLLRAAVRDAPRAVAFADQDDVWLANKLERGLERLADAAAGAPALYCARQVLVDEALVRIGLSCRLRRRPSFAAALTQNIATGCTILLNAEAAGLIAASQPPAGTLHDWWSYLIVAGAGGSLVTDETPVVLYRQHPGSFVGAPSSLARRGVAALRRGPGVFMRVMQQHVDALSAQQHLLSPKAREQLGIVARALSRGPAGRLPALRMNGFARQTVPEHLLFTAWFLMG
jgi:hypothetical protein